ncbi:hypothetical protein, partial [Mycobacterium avium]
MHVTTVTFERGCGGKQIPVHRRHGCGKVVKVQGVFAARDHVLALTTGQPFTVGLRGPGQRVAREEH